MRLIICLRPFGKNYARRKCITDMVIFLSYNNRRIARGDLGSSSGAVFMKRQLAERELTVEGPLKGSGAKRNKRSVTVNLAESPLSWLHSRGHLDDRLFDAGERLRADYERAQMGASVTMRWDPVRAKTTGEGSMEHAERQLAAKQRFDAALKEAGRGLEDVLWRVVCAGESLPAAERTLGWPARSGKLVLKLALDRVADFYRIK
jgi:hypothetical protein